MEAGTINEVEILAAAQRGDKAAFGVLVRQYQRRAYGAAYSLVGNREDSLELAQEAFVKAFRSMGRFDASRPFYPWLYRIVRSTCLNHLKKKKRRGESSLEGMMEKGFDARAAGRGPREIAELGDLKRAIHCALAELSQEQQEIIRLRHFLELSHSEIAQCLDIPRGTVMSRLHGARKRLRSAMDNNREEEPANA